MMLKPGGETIVPQRIFCIGRNYAAHAAELGNPLPERPVIFLKPPSALVPPGTPVPFPQHGAELHFETELVALIGQAGVCADESQAESFIAGLGLGFDLTLRDLQDSLKKQGLPWEPAKAFDASAPIGEFVPFNSKIHDLRRLTYSGYVNGVSRQHGDAALMLYPIPRILVEISRIWRFLPGDLIYTGTPAGVGPLSRGDEIAASAPWCGESKWMIS